MFLQNIPWDTDHSRLATLVLPHHKCKILSWTLVSDCFIKLGSESFVLEVIVLVTLVPVNHCIFWDWKAPNHFVNVTTHDSHAFEKTAAADQVQATVSHNYPDNACVSK